jgi:ketosteroid isomerase-like protein
MSGAPTTEKTRALAKQFVDSVESADFEKAYRLLNHDGRFIMTGQTQVSGVYNGLDDIFARLAPKLAGFTERPEIKVSEIMVDGDKAFIRAVGVGAGQYGPYKQPYYGYFLRAEDDGLSEIIEYLDPVQLELAVFGKKLVPA